MALLEGVFSVKSSYTKLEHLVLFEDLWREEENGVCQYVVNMWKSPSPSKVVAISWKLLLNRVPARENLALRNVL